MERRTLIGILAAGLLVRPRISKAQSVGRTPVVGILNFGAGPRSSTVDAARQGLRDLGFVEGQTIAFDVRYAGMKPEMLPVLAAELVRRKCDVILVSGFSGIRAVSEATGTIPIVAFDLESDPVDAGLARSFAHPGGNITGCFLDQAGLTGKWLELIGEAVPGTRRIAVLRDPTTGPWQLAAIKAVAATMRVELQLLNVQSATELEAVLAAAVNGGSRPLVQLSSPLFDSPLAKRIADFAVRHRVPAISMFSRFPAAGGLMSYGPNLSEYRQRLPGYIDKILKGSKPGDLPIEQPTRFDLAINLGTARALGLTLSPALLARADHVIR